MTVETRSAVLRYGSVVALSLFPYAHLYEFAGRFPAESLVGLPRSSRINATLCLDSASNQVDPIARATHGQRREPEAPTLELSSGAAGKYGSVLDERETMFFSSSGNRLIALDVLPPGDRALLGSLVADGAIAESRARSFIDAADRHYSPACDVPRTDSGITESFWAARGTSVLHHWAFLYEPSAAGSVGGQYGVLVPAVAGALSRFLGPPGPTSFVQTAWWVFALCAVLYVLLVGYVFGIGNNATWVVLLAKAGLFASLGSFVILIAPGYHGARELTLMVPPALYVSWTRERERRLNRYVVVALSALTALLGFALDPQFFMVAALASLAALAPRGVAAIRSQSRAAKVWLLCAAVVCLVVALAAVEPVVASKVRYVMDKLAKRDVTIPSMKREHIGCTLGTAGLGLGLYLASLFRPGLVVRRYFGVVAAIVPVYFFAMPDRSHFLKTLEYALPLYLVIVLEVLRQPRLATIVSSMRGLSRRFPVINTIALACAVVIVVVTVRSESTRPYLRTHDSRGVPYFSYGSHEIGGRHIEAHLSDETVLHLAEFPRDAKSDFVVSPYDKYILMLYDRVNGFGTADLLATLGSNQTQAEVVQTIMSQGATVILDSTALEVNPRLGVKTSHSVLGTSANGSLFHLKTQLRAQSIATTLMESCVCVSTQGRWRVLECPPVDSHEH